VLQVAPSPYRRHAARQRNPEQRSDLAKRDEVLIPHIERVWDANMQVYCQHQPELSGFQRRV